MSDLTGSNDPNDPYCRVPERMPNLQREWKARAYAKVNLHLGVGPVRDDGFHELSTVFQFRLFGSGFPGVHCICAQPRRVCVAQRHRPLACCCVCKGGR